MVEDKLYESKNMIFFLLSHDNLETIILEKFPREKHHEVNFAPKGLYELHTRPRSNCRVRRWKRRTNFSYKNASRDIVESAEVARAVGDIPHAQGKNIASPFSR